MKKAIGVLCLMGSSWLAWGQSFTLVSTATLPYQAVHDGFRGLSGIEYVAGKGWYLGSDRGWDAASDKPQPNAGNLFLVSAGADVGLENAGAIRVQPTYPVSTGASLEGVRFDATTNTLFLATENDDSSTVVYAPDIGKPQQTKTLLRVKNGSANKGIEAIATTPSGHLWVAPEAGWAGETTLAVDSVHFYCYANPTKSRARIAYTYPIDRFPYAHFPADRNGGISDMVAADDSTLLVLERSYHVFRQQQGDTTMTTERVLGRLYEVRVNRTSRTLQKRVAFDFNKPGQFDGILCNAEGICWGPAPPGKRRLYLIADDNFENRPARKTTQQSQLIILEK